MIRIRITNTRAKGGSGLVWSGNCSGCIDRLGGGEWLSPPPVFHLESEAPGEKG